MLFSVVPAITLSIINNDTPILGEDFGFMCEVVIDNDINESISYSFLHNNVTNSSTGPSVSIDTLRLSDTGVYMCSVVIDSPYINNNISLVTSEEDQLVINLTSEFNRIFLHQQNPDKNRGLLYRVIQGPIAEITKGVYK